MTLRQDLGSSQDQGQGHGQKKLRGEEGRIQPSTSALAFCPKELFFCVSCGFINSILPFLLGTPENAVVFKNVWTQNYSSFTHSLLELFRCTTKIFFTTND